MTTRPTPLALVTTLLLITAACDNPKPQTPPPATGGATATAVKKQPPPPVPAAIDPIALKYQKGNGGKCMGRLADHKDYKHDVMWTTKIRFTIDKSNCDSFDPTKACIELSNGDPLLGPPVTPTTPGMPQQYCAVVNGTSIEINVTVSDDMTLVPNYTTHLYSIRYDRDSGDDPEFDVNCTTCDNR